MIDVLGIIAADSAIDHDAVIDGKQECVIVIVSLISVTTICLSMRNSIPHIFAYARALFNITGCKNARAVDL